MDGRRVGAAGPASGAAAPASGAAAPASGAAAPATFCGYCGRPLAEAVHDRCAGRALLEPPRYCAQCRRRMVVQVTPSGWSARCSAHGWLTSTG